MGELVLICQANHIDPEDLDQLAGQLDKDKASASSVGGVGRGIVSQFHTSLVRFFHTQLKMQE